jgi:DNA-binding MarR family transcriptional regulator
MLSVVNGNMGPTTDRTRGLLNALLDLRLELSLLNHRIAAEVGLNDVDLDCLEVISREGPTSPAKLTRRLGVHPATMTGVLTRLEASGWILRSEHPRDRRATLLRIPARREAQLHARYASATQAVVDVVASRSHADIAVVVELVQELSSRARGMG